MDLTNSVVVGLDGSDHARDAAYWAAGWASERDQTLVLMTVHGTVAAERRTADLVWDWPDPAERTEQVSQLLDQTAADIRDKHPDLTIETVVVTADPVRALVRASAEAALVVIGTRRLGGITGRMLGSVADATVARAEGPVVVIPPDYSTRTGPIILGFDLASPPMAAARFAFEAAHTSGRPLLIATVEDPDRPLELIAPLPPTATAHIADLSEREGQVESALEELNAQYADVELAVTIIPGTTAESLLALGAAAELLVVGTRGRSELIGLLFGSVSRTVLRKAEGPAVVVPEPH